MRFRGICEIDGQPIQTHQKPPQRRPVVFRLTFIEVTGHADLKTEEPRLSAERQPYHSRYTRTDERYREQKVDAEWRLNV